MYELMTLNEVSHIWLDEVQDLHHGINAFGTLNRPEYSMSLTNAIRDCLKPYPEERPSVQDLLEKIERNRILLHEHLSEEARDDLPPPRWGLAQRLYYRGNEINEMRPGKEPLAPDEGDRDPVDADGFRDPNLSPVRFPQFPDAVLRKRKENNNNKDLGRDDIVRKNDKDRKGKARTHAIWNRWHARENDGVDLRADTMIAGFEEEEDPEYYSGDGDGDGESIDLDYEDGAEEDPIDYSGDGEWSCDPSVSSNADPKEPDQISKVFRRPHISGKKLPGLETNLPLGSKGKGKASRRSQAGPVGEDEHEEDQSPIQNHRLLRKRVNALPPSQNPSLSNTNKRKAPQNPQKDFEQSLQNQTPSNPPKRRRLLRRYRTPSTPTVSPLSSIATNVGSGIGPEEGGHVEQEGEVEDENDDTHRASANDNEDQKDANDGTYREDSPTTANDNEDEDEDDDDTPTPTPPPPPPPPPTPMTRIVKRRRRRVSWGSRCYRAPGRGKGGR